MYADPQVEGILAGCLGDVLVGTDTGSFEGLGGELLVLIGNEMATEGEFVDGSALAAEVEDTNLGERDE